ncbi:hypothetical protein Ddc_03776 [Ditylenchus destructor]|nr:hypothetical protein Ddc_03776 [Ditylenchus destructor]
MLRSSKSILILSVAFLSAVYLSQFVFQHLGQIGVDVISAESSQESKPNYNRARLVEDVSGSKGGKTEVCKNRILFQWLMIVSLVLNAVLIAALIIVCCLHKVCPCCACCC